MGEEERLGGEVLRFIVSAVSDLYARQRALLAGLERHGIVQPETFETEVEQYRRDRAEVLARDVQDWLDYLARMARMPWPPPHDPP